MKIIPATGQDISDIREMSLTVKLLPEPNDGLVPVFYMTSPADDYPMTVGHLRLMITGLELAIGGVDCMIGGLLKSLKDNALENMKEWYSVDDSTDLERILNLISSLEEDDEELND